MSYYADPSNLVSLHLASSSTHWDSRLKQMLATSLVVHAVLLLGLTSLRLAPTIKQPKASYYVDLVAVPDSQVTFPKQESKPAKKAPVQPPIKSKSKPQAKPPLPIPEPVTESIVSVVDSVVFPQRREMTPIEKSSILPPPKKLLRKSKVENSSLPLPVIPQAPELPTLSPSSQKVKPAPMKSVPTGLIAETFKQTMKSVTVPHKFPEQQVSISIAAKPKEKPIVPSTKTRSTTVPKIATPGQVPQLFKDVPVSKLKKTEPITRSQSRLSDSLKQVMQSVIVPKVKKPTVPKSKYTPMVAVPVPSRQEFNSILSKEIPEIVPEPAQLDLSQQTIAKLVIPEVKELQAHHVLSSPTEGGVKKTKTALQVAGISSEGNVYWGRVWSKIDREWVAPAVEVRSDQPIHVLLAFRLERNGAVKNLSIEESSGNRYYDLAAKRAVLDAAPLPAFLSDMLEPYYDIQFQFTVNLDFLS